MKSKTFCVLPWIHAATLTNGNVQLCCVSGGGSGVNLNEQTLADYWNSEYVRDARRRMLKGKEVEACKRCYREEAHGLKSHRIVENEAWQRKLGPNAIQQLIDKTSSNGSVDAELQYVDLRLGNTCNLRCIMCSPRESSRWLSTARRLSELFQREELRKEWEFKSKMGAGRFEWYRNPAFWANLQTILPHVKEVILAGGEPFLIEEQFEFVKACCEMGEAYHVRLRYHTNGTVFPKDMSRYWEQFERVHFMISIDGIGEVANYVRYPSNWEEIETNIRQFDCLPENTITSFNFTTSALNIYHLPEVLDWSDRSGLRKRKCFKDLQEYVHPSLVHYPAYLSIRVLPRDYKQLVTDRIRKYMERRLKGQTVDRLKAILEFMNSEDHSKRMPDLVDYTKMLDTINESDVIKTFPEIASYWTR
jgi:MoaA/NifB/PqqE/SkfB family radical SAM enzyme